MKPMKDYPMRKFFWLSVAGCVLLPSAVFADAQPRHSTSVLVARH
jgi:hypothetical protein